ncbi:MAG: rhodanese [Desulfobulbaceae bacterium BRH_c16a]|nr:MAG: rhodanese [Desulfobulbaceae bacterium BRH_c16a]
MKVMKRPILQALRQIPLLMVMASLMAVAVNHWRETPLPLIDDWSATARLTDRDGKTPAIHLDQAKQLFERKTAIFLDTRPQSQYEDGHISGALSLPWQDVTSAFTEIAGELEDNQTIVTYCDGENCELSHDLAMFLKEMGFTDVRVLINGWTVWQDAGLPSRKTGEADER